MNFRKLEKLFPIIPLRSLTFAILFYGDRFLVHPLKTRSTKKPKNQASNTELIKVLHVRNVSSSFTVFFKRKFSCVYTIKLKFDLSSAYSAESWIHSFIGYCWFLTVLEHFKTVIYIIALLNV